MGRVKNLDKFCQSLLHGFISARTALSIRLDTVNADL